MAEYIEREAAVKIAEKYGTTNGSVLGRHSGVADCIAAMIDAIPAADVMPVSWVSVKDKLPQNKTRVLAYSKYHDIHDVIWSWADNCWYDKITGGAYMEDFITHWMPLPLPPKAVRTDN